MSEADLTDVLPTIAVPTLLLWGEFDARSPLSVAHAFARAIPRAELAVIPGAGHMTNLERPAEFNAAVRAFCRALPLAGRTVCVHARGHARRRSGSSSLRQQRGRASGAAAPGAMSWRSAFVGGARSSGPTIGGPPVKRRADRRPAQPVAENVAGCLGVKYAEIASSSCWL